MEAVGKDVEFCPQFGNSNRYHLLIINLQKKTKENICISDHGKGVRRVAVNGFNDNSFY